LAASIYFGSFKVEYSPQTSETFFDIAIEVSDVWGEYSTLNELKQIDTANL
jgi:hypothetical protein